MTPEESNICRTKELLAIYDSSGVDYLCFAAVHSPLRMLKTNKISTSTNSQLPNGVQPVIYINSNNFNSNSNKFIFRYYFYFNFTFPEGKKGFLGTNYDFVLSQNQNILYFNAVASSGDGDVFLCGLSLTTKQFSFVKST